MNRLFSNVERNLDLSIVFYIPTNYIGIYSYFNNISRFLRQNGCEVFVFFKNILQKEILLEVVKREKFINWTIIFQPNNSNRFFLNIVTSISKRKFLIFFDGLPFLKDNLFLTLRKQIEIYPESYILTYSENFKNKACILFDTRDVHKIDFYKISTTFSILDFANLLEFYGIRKNISIESTFSLQECENYFYNQEKVNNNELHYKIIFRWNNNPYRTDQCKEYISIFDKSCINPSMMKKRYNSVLLCQAYNEEKNICDFLTHMSDYFDGMILLDDGSNDQTYEKTSCEKIIVKIKKKRYAFNDLENRNILLNIASFINSKWFCFMDIDERFDQRFTSFFKDLDKIKEDSVLFPFVHLWDSNLFFNPALPDVIKDGVFVRWRMFRNVGWVNIFTNQSKLHFSVSPIMFPFAIAPILVLHYGIIDRSQRLLKYNFYKEEDNYKDLKDYSYLQQTNTSLLPIKSINKNKINKLLLFFNWYLKNYQISLIYKNYF